MMKLKLLAASALTLIVAAPALAQEAVVAGPRVEARVGYDNVNVNVAFDDGVDSLEANDGESGVAYGVEAGYDVTVNKLLIGGYVGITGASTGYCSEIYGEDEGCIKAGRDITLGARLGYVMKGGAAIYAKGGYSNGQVKAEYEDFEDILEDFEVSEEVDGFHLGAGLEASIGATGIYGKLEYVYTNYANGEFVSDDFDARAGLERHQVFAGLGIRF
jgi:outer membrane immunogenic protein